MTGEVKEGSLKPFNDLVGRQASQQRRYRPPRSRMPPVGRQIGQWSQDEGPSLHPGMRQDRPARSAGGDFSMKINEIEVDQTSRIGDGPDTAKGALDLVQSHQQRVGRQA